MRTIALLIAVWSILVGPTQATEYLQTLKAGSWVCSTPEAYDTAIAQEQGGTETLEHLKTRLLDQKQCIYMDADFIDRIMAPFAKVVERQGTKVKVEFTVQYRKRLQFLPRQISRVTLVGWTEAVNLVDQEIL
jgi:hypothetical protein